MSGSDQKTKRNFLYNYTKIKKQQQKQQQNKVCYLILRDILLS